MMKITEEKIPRENEPLFIDYSKIYGNPKKKLQFLRALIQIINTRADFIQFDKLGLNPEDTKLFTDYLRKYYSKNFDPKKNSINLFENYDGKIICGIDQMIEDLFTLLSNERLDSAPSEISNIMPRQTENVDDDNKEQVLTYLIFEVFYDWIFIEKYQKDNFDSESKIYLNDFFEFNESDLVKNFNIQKIRDEIYKNFKKSHFKSTQILEIRTKLVTCLEELEKHSNNKDYWASLILETKKIFKNLIDATTISNNEKMKLFFTFPGNPHIHNVNKVVGNYRDKTVLFQKDAPIFSSIEKNQIIQGEIKNETEKAYFVNPIRIIDLNEAKILLLFGVDAAPSTEYVSHFLDDN